VQSMHAAIRPVLMRAHLVKMWHAASQSMLMPQSQPPSAMSSQEAQPYDVLVRQRSLGPMPCSQIKIVDQVKVGMFVHVSFFCFDLHTHTRLQDKGQPPARSLG